MQPGAGAEAEERPAGFHPPDWARLSGYGWSWSDGSSVDQNYMDLAYLTARNSSCKDGHMGCVIVRGLAPGAGTERPPAPTGQVVLRTINTPLFGAFRSDCHAEANAVAALAAEGVPLRGCSCYVTRAPCGACYKLLAVAGIGRIVAPQPLDSPDCRASAGELGIECCVVLDDDQRAGRREALGRSNEDMDRVRALREERKRLRKEGKFGKKSIRKLGQGDTAQALTSSQAAIHAEP